MSMQVAVGFETGLLEIRSLPEGKLLHSFGNIHDRDVQRVAFGPEDHWLAAASLDGRATVWKKTGEQWQLFGTLTHGKGVNAVAFAPDGRRVLTASYDGQLGQLLLDTLDTPQPSFTRLYSDQEMNAVTLDDSGQWVLTTTDTGAQLWNQADWQSPSWQQAISQYSSGKTTFWGALSPDHRQVALVGDYFKLKIYPQESEPYYLPGHDETVIRALFTPGGQQLLTVGGDNKIKAWDLRQRTLLFSLSLPSSAKDSVWDFDFRCPSQQSQTELKGCWLAAPLSVERRVVLYQLGN